MSTEPLDDLSCLTTQGRLSRRQAVACAVDQASACLSGNAPARGGSSRTKEGGGRGSRKAALMTGQSQDASLNTGDASPPAPQSGPGDGVFKNTTKEYPPRCIPQNDPHVAGGHVEPHVLGYLRTLTPIPRQLVGGAHHGCPEGGGVSGKWAPMTPPPNASQSPPPPPPPMHPPGILQASPRH